MAKQYLNTQYGKALFKQQGLAPAARSGGNPRAGMNYSLGVTPKGNVVHIYRDGERIVMHEHAPHAAPPHPASFGGTVAPDTQNYGDYIANLQREVLAAHQAKQPTVDAQDLQHQAVLQAAALALQSQHGA